MRENVPVDGAQSTIIAKIRGIRGRYLLHNPNENNKTKAIKDLAFANKNIDNNTVFCQELFWLKLEEDKYYEAYLLDRQYLGNLFGNELRQELEIKDCDYILESPIDIFNQIYNDFVQFIESASYFSNEKYTSILQAIISRLFRDNKYRDIIELIRHFDSNILSDVLFEIAYSYYEIGKMKESKRYYELTIKINGFSTSSANNIALIYEKEGNYLEAEKLLLKALSIDKNYALANKNYKRVKKLSNAKNEFIKDTAAVKKNIYKLWQLREYDGIIYFSKEVAKSVFNLSSYAAKTKINKLLDRGYLIAIGCDQYRINPKLDKHLMFAEGEMKFSDEIDAISRNISANKLNEIGFNEQLLINLNKLNSNDLTILLKRDLKETAVNVLCHAYKGVIVMCGSMVEALLLDKILALKIKSYVNEKGKKTSVMKMALDDLLYVAQSEKIIDVQLYHLGHALRNYRNLIHPGVEQRKKTMIPNESNAKIAWDVTKKIFMDI